ncbi:MAG: hypothetical protein VX715_06995 [Planctomycetota bacterium]|nr:hypothetical protein [Planctomycetota bacterium]
MKAIDKGEREGSEMKTRRFRSPRMLRVALLPLGLVCWPAWFFLLFYGGILWLVAGLGEFIYRPAEMWPAGLVLSVVSLLFVFLPSIYLWAYLPIDERAIAEGRVDRHWLLILAPLLLLSWLFFPVIWFFRGTLVWGLLFWLGWRVFFRPGKVSPAGTL